ncbi:MAG: hypothetical protein R3D57_01790 [Hyphomicrobiaceae bacterium]
MSSETYVTFDVPPTSEILEKGLDEQRALYRALTRSIDDMTHRGEEPPEHWQTLQLALREHFIALSQGR